MTREVCSLEVFARDVAPEYWAIVNAADGRACVTDYFATRGALFEHIARWLSDSQEAAMSASAGCRPEDVNRA